MKTTEESGSFGHSLLAGVLQVVLVGGLFGVGWSLYDRLPPNSASQPPGGAAGLETEVRIVMRRAVDNGPSADGVNVEIYSQDAVRPLREPNSAPLLLEPKGRRRAVEPALKTHLDESGQATVRLRPGRWWFSASLPGAHELTWRLPVDISSQPLTVELTPENAYTREKTF
ncbi:MAG: hypothetical protein WKF84_12025 [Pyrinomonadaceae bacterium]